MSPASSGPPPSLPFVLDVRSPREWHQFHLEGSANVPLNHLKERLEEIPRDRRVVVHCASGYRSSIAASLLEQHGFKRLADLAGGINAWPRSEPAAAATR